MISFTFLPFDPVFFSGWMSRDYCIDCYWVPAPAWVTAVNKYLYIGDLWRTIVTQFNALKLNDVLFIFCFIWTKFGALKKNPKSISMSVICQSFFGTFGPYSVAAMTPSSAADRVRSPRFLEREPSLQVQLIDSPRSTHGIKGVYFKKNAYIGRLESIKISFFCYLILHRKIQKLFWKKYRNFSLFV